MKMLKKLSRLSQIAAYNRDWYRYLPPFAASRGQGTQLFRLRNGQRLEVPTDARFILNEIYLDRVYDVPGMEYADLDHVLDIGANVGLFASYIASRNPGTKIHCFEPARSNFLVLQRNIHHNRINAQTHAEAISTASGTGYLSHTGSSVEYALQENNPGDDVEEVRCIALEQVFERCGVSRFQLLKMDIEGHEKPLLDNANDDLLRCFDRIMIEWHYTWEELQVLAERLQGIGFDARPLLIEGHMRFLWATLSQGGLAASSTHGEEFE